MARPVTALKNKKPEAITVLFIDSFVNSSHEHRASRILKEEFPGIPISLSSSILPELMEYGWTLIHATFFKLFDQTTVVSAMVRPRVEKYLDSLQSELKDLDICILRSDSGLTSPMLAKEYSCNLLYSGPAGGVAGVTGGKVQNSLPVFCKYIQSLDIVRIFANMHHISLQNPEIIIHSETILAQLSRTVPSSTMWKANGAVEAGLILEEKQTRQDSETFMRDKIGRLTLISIASNCWH
ncbi:hypothetical protein C8R43DRAFT_953381 [Mycena crocata]|nr:hypothetical protein C8R43DRAFT_953381 [Mycena crocata]